MKRIDWRWHIGTVRYWLKETRCDLFGHREVVETPHRESCCRPGHEDYPVDRACHYCERWL